jgi:2-phosphoglycolate phosphatase
MLDFKGVLFDLDGTLLDTVSDITSAFKFILPEGSMHLFSAEEIRLAATYGSPSFYALAQKKGVSLPPFNEFRHQLVEAYSQRKENLTCLFEGIDSVIHALDEANIPWGIVTNKQEASAKLDVKRFDALKNCACVIGYDTAAYPKPAPEPVFLACERLDLPTDKTIFVGDSNADMEAATHAGCIKIGVTYGYGDLSYDDQYAPDHLIDKPLDLLALFT